MSGRRPGTSKALVAIGIVSSICAATATYLYLTTNTASVSSSPRRRKIMISGASVSEIAAYVPMDSVFDNEVYIVLKRVEGGEFYERLFLQEHCTYFLRHETVGGLTHISRHISPDVIILLPGMSGVVKVDDIKDWVGKVALISDATSKATGNIHHFSPQTTYTEVLSSL